MSGWERTRAPPADRKTRTITVPTYPPCTRVPINSTRNSRIEKIRVPSPRSRKCVLELALRDAFHDCTMNRGADDTREWQLVGTMSPRLINIQPATPRPVTTTRYAFTFRDDREPPLPCEERKGKEITTRLASNIEETVDAILPIRVVIRKHVFSFPRIKITVHRTVTQQRTSAHEKGSIHRNLLVLFFFFSLSFFPLYEHNSTKRFAMIQWLNTRHETKARFLCPREQLSFSSLVIRPRVAHLSNIGK